MDVTQRRLLNELNYSNKKTINIFTKKGGKGKNKKFEIKVTKNIPQKSGLGGGSMNAASILKYLMKKKIVNISSKKVKELANKFPIDLE